jgi:hypothetical protein
MRKTVAIAVLLGGAAGLYAQGTIELSDYNGNADWNITIWSPQLASPTQETQGNSAYDNPSGSTVYTGTPLGGSATGSGPTAYENGNLWSLAIYAAPGVNNTAGLTAAETTGQPIAVSLFQTSGGTGPLNAGTWGAASAGVWALDVYSTALTTLPAGFTGSATFQLAAWYNGGVAPTLANADAGVASSSVYGWSSIETIAALGGTGSPAADAGTLGNRNQLEDGAITSFSLETATVPEPKTIALGVIGAPAFLFRRRK